MHSILIKGGRVIDGTGAPTAPLDVAIGGAKIAGLYKHSEAKASLAIDASGMIVCPGFIDIHSHSDLHLLSNPLAESKIRQGVTTELVGNCGGSAAPLLGDAMENTLEYARQPELDIDIDWVSMDEYLLRLSNLKTSVNVASLVGAETLRRCVIGPSGTKATSDQLLEMNRLLADAMLQGAFGLSSGLIYAPGCFASTEEIISLAATSASFGGFYTSHIRGEAKTLVKAVEEAITIGREAHTRVQISHHKACGKQYWGTVDTTLRMIEDARMHGVDVAFDVHPYTASCSSLDLILPPWARDGDKKTVIARLTDGRTRKLLLEGFETPSGTIEDPVLDAGWENIMMVGFRNEAHKIFENKSVAEAARMTGQSPGELALDLLVEEDLMVSAVFHDMCEDDVIKVIRHPLASICTDLEVRAPYGPGSKSATHPRGYGSFPRVIRRYVLEKGLMTMEEAIRKMTSWPAERMRLDDRGVLAKGMAADVVIFDPDKIADRATFEDPHRYPDGIEYVIVNGAVTISKGEHTRERAGQILRHKPGIA